jgi:hypothetical protein
MPVTRGQKRQQKQEAKERTRKEREDGLVPGKAYLLPSGGCVGCFAFYLATNQPREQCIHHAENCVYGNVVE